ncbi:MAG: hypothetical protein ACLVG5_10760 [Clostridium sp.]
MKEACRWKRNMNRVDSSYFRYRGSVIHQSGQFSPVASGVSQ